MKTNKIAIALLAIGFQAAVFANTVFDGDIKNNTLAVSPTEDIAIVAKSNAAEILVYDLKQGKKIKTLTNVKSPRNIIFDKTGKYYFLSDSTKGTVEKRQSDSHQAVITMAVGPGAFGTTLSSDGSKIFINNQASDTVTVYDVTSGSPLSVIKGFSQPRQGIKDSPTGDFVYVTNFKGDKISVVDANNFALKSEISGFNKLRAISVTKDGKTLFAANSGNDTLSKVNLVSGKIEQSIEVGKEPYGAALRPDEKYLYSGNLADNSLTVISLPDFKVVNTIKGFNGPRQAISFSKDSTKAWVLNEDLSLSEVDLKQNKITKTLH